MYLKWSRSERFQQSIAPFSFFLSFSFSFFFCPLLYPHKVGMHAQRKHPTHFNPKYIGVAITPEHVLGTKEVKHRDPQTGGGRTNARRPIWSGHQVETDATKTSCSREINQVYKTPNVDTTPFIDPSPFEIK